MNENFHNYVYCYNVFTNVTIPFTMFLFIHAHWMSDLAFLYICVWSASSYPVSGKQLSKPCDIRVGYRTPILLSNERTDQRKLARICAKFKKTCWTMWTSDGGWVSLHKSDFLSKVKGISEYETQQLTRFCIFKIWYGHDSYKHRGTSLPYTAYLWR